MCDRLEYNGMRTSNTGYMHMQLRPQGINQHSFDIPTSLYQAAPLPSLMTFAELPQDWKSNLVGNSTFGKGQATNTVC